MFSVASYNVCSCHQAELKRLFSWSVFTLNVFTTSLRQSFVFWGWRGWGGGGLNVKLHFSALLTANALAKVMCHFVSGLKFVVHFSTL